MFPKQGEFTMPSSMYLLKVLYEISFLPWCRGRYNRFIQVLAFGLTFSQKPMLARGSKPRGGTRLAPVAKARISSSVTLVAPAKYGWKRTQLDTSVGTTISEV